MPVIPFATKRLIPPGSNDPRIKARIGILHVDATNAASLYDYFANRSGGIESHGHIRRDGSMDQYRDTAYQADANYLANDFALSFETQGYGEGEWTPEQLATIKRVMLWAKETHGIPLRVVTCWNDPEGGWGYHTLFGAPSQWTPVAKSCPGPKRIKQFHEVLVPWMREQSAPKPKPRVTERRLTLVLANLWRENPSITADLKTLASKRADIIACNEGAGFSDALEAVPGYQAFGVTGSRLERQNPILVRDGIEVEGTEYRIMCEAVGTSPARSARVVRYTLAGQKRAHVNTHANSHVQQGTANPHELPRVTKYVEHMTNLSTLVRQLQAQGYRVTVSGDLNWSFQTKVLAWYWSPQRVFKRLGLRNQWQHRDATAPSHGKRRIDYIAHDADDLRIWEECLVRGHSDHGWPMVTYRIVKES